MNRVRADWTSGVPVLVVTECDRCENHWYLPQAHCPVCGSDEAVDVAARGGGLCVAVTRLHVTAGDEHAPIRLCLVELDEGPVVMGRVQDELLAPGDRAAVGFQADGQDGTLVPGFAREGSS